MWLRFPKRTCSLAVFWLKSASNRKTKNLFRIFFILYRSRKTCNIFLSILQSLQKPISSKSNHSRRTVRRRFICISKVFHPIVIVPIFCCWNDNLHNSPYPFLHCSAHGSLLLLNCLYDNLHNFPEFSVNSQQNFLFTILCWYCPIYMRIWIIFHFFKLFCSLLFS